jgi:hypothetical protein
LTPRAGLWKALAKKLRRTVQNWEETHLEEIGNLTVERDNLQFRLSLVTQDPESLASQLLSKHNALKLASKNLDMAVKERDAARQELRDNRRGLHKEVARCGELKAALEQAPYQAFLNEQRAHAETREALQLQQNTSLAMANTLTESKALLRAFWLGADSIRHARVVFEWFKSYGEDLNALTPAPSPGAAFKALVERVGDSADGVDVFCTSDPGRSGK